MQSKVGTGIVAGLIAGAVFGILMTIMNAPTPDGGEMPMMKMVAMVVGSTSLFVGWVYHLFNSIVIGAIFGALFNKKLTTYKNATGWGAFYGAVWWVLGGLILMPIMLDMAAFAPLTEPGMRSVAMGSLIGHLVYGLVLGAAYIGISHRPTPKVRHPRSGRAPA
ncbi:MAG: hypothetical protein KC478_15650 [Bacteriovoracaceae bacterium]|nr:hypothetical protein [Bacteriovoracaceae bacterium]